MVLNQFLVLSDFGKHTGKTRLQSPHSLLSNLSGTLFVSLCQQSEEKIVFYLSSPQLLAYFLISVCDQLALFRFHSTHFPRNTLLRGGCGMHQLSLISQDPIHRPKILLWAQISEWAFVYFLLRRQFPYISAIKNKSVHKINTQTNTTDQNWVSHFQLHWTKGLAHGSGTSVWSRKYCSSLRNNKHP